MPKRAPDKVGRLAKVRLSDLDPKLLKRAAATARKRVGDVDVSPEARLMARLFDFRTGEDELEALERAARAPSDRIYWVPERAVRKVLGP